MSQYRIKVERTSDGVVLRGDVINDNFWNNCDCVVLPDEIFKVYGDLVVSAPRVFSRLTEVTGYFSAQTGFFPVLEKVYSGEVFGGVELPALTSCHTLIAYSGSILPALKKVKNARVFSGVDAPALELVKELDVFGAHLPSLKKVSRLTIREDGSEFPSLSEVDKLSMDAKAYLPLLRRVGFCTVADGCVLESLSSAANLVAGRNSRFPCLLRCDHLEAHPGTFFPRLKHVRNLRAMRKCRIPLLEHVDRVNVFGCCHLPSLKTVNFCTINGDVLRDSRITLPALQSVTEELCLFSDAEFPALSHVERLFCFPSAVGSSASFRNYVICHRSRLFPRLSVEDLQKSMSSNRSTFGFSEMGEVA